MTLQKLLSLFLVLVGVVVVITATIIIWWKIIILLLLMAFFMAIDNAKKKSWWTRYVEAIVILSYLIGVLSTIVMLIAGIFWFFVEF